MDWTSAEDELQRYLLQGLCALLLLWGENTSQDLKAGHLLGATPKFQQIGIYYWCAYISCDYRLYLKYFERSSTIYSSKNLASRVSDVANLKEMSTVMILRIPKIKTATMCYVLPKCKLAGPCRLVAGKILSR